MISHYSFIIIIIIKRTYVFIYILYLDFVVVVNLLSLRHTCATDRAIQMILQIQYIYIYIYKCTIVHVHVHYSIYTSISS